MRLPAPAPPPASPRHLSDLPFRFERPAPVAVAPWAPPSRGAAWSLDDVLAALDRGAGVFDAGPSLRLAHAYRRPELAAAIQTYDLEVRWWRHLGLTARPPSPEVRAWPRQVRLIVEWLDASGLLTGGTVQIRPGVTIADGDAFRSGVQSRLEAGPAAAEASALVADLEALFARHAAPPESQTTATPPRRFARAA